MNRFRTFVLAALTAVAGMVSVANAQTAPLPDEGDWTGSWADPQARGTGFLIDDAPEGHFVYWFNYETGVPYLDAGQAWFVTDLPASINDVFTLYQPTGTFNASGGFEVGEPVGTLRFYQSYTTGFNDWLRVEYNFYDFGPCVSPIPSPVWPGCSGAFDLERITRRFDPNPDA